MSAIRELMAPHSSGYARVKLASAWSSHDVAVMLLNGDYRRIERQDSERWADYAIAYELAAVVYPANAAQYLRWAAGWAALVVGEEAVRAIGGDPAPRAEIEGEVPGG